VILRRSIALLVSMAAMAAISAPPPASAGSWLPPQSLLGAGADGQFDVVHMTGSALGANGDAAIAWLVEGAPQLQLRPAGGAWSGGIPFPQALSFDVGVAGSGATDVVYSEAVAGGTHVAVTTHVAAGWQPAVEIAPAGTAVLGLHAFVGDDGTALAVWLRQTDATTSVLQWARRGPDGMWSHGDIAGNARTQDLLAVSHLPSGTLAVGWVDAASGDAWVATGTTQVGGFAPEHTTLHGPLRALQVSPNGTVIGVAIDGADGSVVAAVRERMTHVWQLPKILIQPTGGAVAREVTGTAGSNGDVWFAIWLFNEPENDQVAIEFSAGGQWGLPESVASNQLDIEDGYFHTQLGVLADGTVLAAHRDLIHLAVRARQPDGSWVQQFDAALGSLATEFDPEAFLMSSSGDALIVAETDTCYFFCYGYVVPYDGAPPQMSMSVPASGVQGQPVTMTASALDSLSPLDSATKWAFDDGGAASGDSVAHTFSSAGDHVISVSRADALGQMATRSRTIHIALAPVDCPGAVVLPGGSTCPAPMITKFSAKVAAKWTVSRLRGAATVRAHLGAGRLAGSVALLRPDGTAVRTIKFSPRSDLVAKLAFPLLADPGRWSVRITARDTLGHVAKAVRKVTLPAPPEGVVRETAIAADPSRPATLTLDGKQRRANARFVFSSRPKAGQRVVVTWYYGKRVVWRVFKPSLRVVTAWFALPPTGPPLPAGTWRCEIRAGDRIAKVITFNVVD
jgi:PKD domain-containing protein